MKIILFMSLILSCIVYAEDKTATDPKQKEMMQKMMEYGTPGEAHKVLAQMAGKWTYTSKYWEAADTKPMESKGTSNIKMLMGGRFLQHETKGTAMGQPFEGLGFTGYDNIKKRYDTVWIDNMGTGIMHGKGEYDPKTQTLTDSGEFTCPMTQDKTATYRSEWKIVDKNNTVYSMYGKGMDDSGKEFKMMEMTYKRNK